MSVNIIRDLVREEIQKVLAERVTTNAMEIASKIGKEVDGLTLVDMNYTSNGLEGRLSYDLDNQYMYEFTITPVKKH